MTKTKEEKAEYMRKYYAEKLKENLAKRYVENAEKVKADRAKYRAENPEKVKASKARYYSENTEKIKTSNTKWQKENAEKVKATRAKWRRNNPEKTKASKAKGVAELKDYYIKGVLVAQGFPKESITPELIELKRITLKTSRLCLRLKN